MRTTPIQKDAQLQASRPDFGTPYHLSDFETMGRLQRRDILLEQILVKHTWHYERNRAYRSTLQARGIGKYITPQDLPLLLRPTAQTFKSYIDILGTPFPNDAPQSFLEWLAKQLSADIPKERFKLFKTRYSTLEAFLRDFEHFFCDYGFEILTSSGTSGRSTILIRDQDAIQMTVVSFYHCFQRYFDMQLDHRVIFMMPPEGRIAMARMAAFSLKQMGIPEDGFHFTIPFAAYPDQVRIRTGRTFRPGWRGQLEQQIESPFMNWMYEHYVSPRAIKETVKLLYKFEASGEKVLIFGSWSHLHGVSLSLQAQKRKMMLAEGSVLGTGGGFKELYPFTSDQIRADLEKTFLSPSGEPTPFRDVYGMAEANWAAMQCRFGSYHIPAWVLTAVINENGQFLSGESDEGVLAFFDPIAGGDLFPAFFRTSDRVRLVNGLLSPNAQLDCPCGSPGEYIQEGSIRRVDRLDEAGCAGQV